MLDENLEKLKSDGFIINTEKIKRNYCVNFRKIRNFFRSILTLFLNNFSDYYCIISDRATISNQLITNRKSCNLKKYFPKNIRPFKVKNKAKFKHLIPS